MDSTKTRTGRGEAVPSNRITPLKLNPSLSGPPVPFSLPRSKPRVAHPSRFLRRVGVDAVGSACSPTDSFRHGRNPPTAVRKEIFYLFTHRLATAPRAATPSHAVRFAFGSVWDKSQTYRFLPLWAESESLPSARLAGTPCLGGNVGDVLGEPSPVTPRVLYRILPLSERHVRWCFQDLRTTLSSMLKMRVDILNMHSHVFAHFVRSRTPKPSARAAQHDRRLSSRQ